MRRFRPARLAVKFAQGPDHRAGIIAALAGVTLRERGDFQFFVCFQPFAGFCTEFTRALTAH